MPTGSIIKLIKPVYGLDDAPIRWHHTLLKFFKSIGFERSLLEPCWLIKRKGSDIVAMVLLEVDDVNVACLKECQEELHRQMTDRFLFGKFEHQQADFRRQDGDL